MPCARSGGELRFGSVSRVPVTPQGPHKVFAGRAGPCAPRNAPAGNCVPEPRGSAPRPAGSSPAPRWPRSRPVARAAPPAAVSFILQKIPRAPVGSQLHAQPASPADGENRTTFPATRVLPRAEGSSALPSRTSQFQSRSLTEPTAPLPFPPGAQNSIAVPSRS